MPPGNESLRLRDINRTFSTGYLRRDSTARHPVRSIPFAVSFDSGGAGLHLFPGDADDAFHATAVASMAVGSHLLGGAAGGSAPGAQVVLVSAGRSLGEMIGGFIRAAQDPRIDVITSSQAGESFPGAGESIVALIVERVIARYGKPILVAANNAGPALSTTMEQANDPDVIAVGASVTRAAYRAHYGWELPEAEMVLGYSSRGPTLNGGLKPDVLAPPMSLAATPCGDSSFWARDRALRYTMPSCYVVGGGTSLASPAAAGVAAVLISAAKQRGLPYDARRIAWAVRYGARLLPGFAPYEQGHGVVDVARAWTLLQARVELPEIITAAPVNTALNRYLRTPGQGVGLYEREGWTAGQRATRQISLTRTSGADRPLRYGLRWRQNDGTFSAPTTVTLPLNAPVSVPIQIAPTTTGVHSAALELIDRPSRYPVHDVLVTVVAAERFTTANRYAVTLAKTIPWPRSGSFFVEVPPGTSMLRLDLGVKSGRLRLRAQDPTWTEFLTWTSYFQPDLVPQVGFFPLGPGQRGTLLVPHPQPGVWEISLEPGSERDPGDSLQYHVPAQVELHASVGGVGTAAPVMAGSGGAGSSIAAAWTNQFAALDRAATHGALGTLRTRSGEVDSTLPGPLYQVEVDSGTTTLRVQVTPADTTADLDLYLYNCSSGTCYLWDLDRSIRATKSHLVRFPRPGTWKVLIDPARVPGGKTRFTYTEILTHPKYGTATAVGAPARREVGEGWTDSVRVERARISAPDSTRLVAVLDLVDEGAEAAEQAHPFAVFAGVPYRPVVVGSVFHPLDAECETNGQVRASLRLLRFHSPEFPQATAYPSARAFSPTRLSRVTTVTN